MYPGDGVYSVSGVYNKPKLTHKYNDDDFKS